MWNRRLSRRNAVRLSLSALAVGLVAWLAPSKRANAGYGACDQGDGCQAYMEPANGDICMNCGHNYTFHW